MASLVANPSVNGNIGNWKQRHNEAITAATRGVHTTFEGPMVRMMTGWATYAADHHNRFESAIGEDYILGVEWLKIGKALLGLLNGETGRLDCGTCDGFIRDTILENGFTEEQLDTA